jgi:predicted hydrocarbon binding protein
MITLDRPRSVLSTPALLRALRELIESERKPIAAVEALRQAGFRAGESFHSAFEGAEGETGENASPAAMPAELFWERFSRFWSAQGWGELHHRELHPGVSALESRDWVEAEISSGVSGCHLTTGIFAELLRRIAGQEIAVLEGSCRGRGDQTCSFLIGNAETLEAVYAAMRQGSTVEAAIDGLA